jgi:hypothetical protein
MNNEMLDVITRIINDYGTQIFEDIRKTNAILLDLAPSMKRERMLVRSFIELDGFNTLKTLGATSYLLAEKKLVNNLIDTFAMEKSAALWAVRLFGVALGHIPPDETPIKMPKKSDAAEIPIPSDSKGRASSLSGERYLSGQVAIGRNHVIAVSADRMVVARGANESFQCDISGWRGDIISVAAGDTHSLGLKTDGTVLVAGSNAYDQCDVGTFTNVRAIYAFGHDSVCVKADGTAVAVGRSKWDLSAFTNIVSLARYPEGVIGIRDDGKLCLAGYMTDEDMVHENAWLLAQKDVSQVISTYVNGSFVLTNEGKLYKSGEPENYFAPWRDLVSIVDLSDSFAVLNKNGTVRIIPYNRERPRLVTVADKWRNVATIYGGYKRLIGLTIDGTLLVAYTDPAWIAKNMSMAIDYVTNWYPMGVWEE